MDASFEFPLVYLIVASVGALVFGRILNQPLRNAAHHILGTLSGIVLMWMMTTFLPETIRIAVSVALPLALLVGLWRWQLRTEKRVEQNNT